MKAIFLFSNSTEIEDKGFVDGADYSRIFDPLEVLGSDNWIYYFDSNLKAFRLFNNETAINCDTIFVIFDSDSNEFEDGQFYLDPRNDGVFKNLKDLFNESVIVCHSKPHEKIRKEVKLKLSNVIEEIKAQHNRKEDSLFFQIYSRLADINQNRADIKFFNTDISNSADIIEEVFKIAGKIKNDNHKLEFLYLCLTKNGQKEALEKGYPLAFSVVEEFEALNKIDECLSEPFGEKLTIIRDKVLLLSDNPQ
jgi:hypothetical protein